MFNHLMVDLETMGGHNNAVITSIGAVEFDINTGKTGREFNVNINIQSCLNAGLEVTGNTIYWWLQQSEIAREAMLTQTCDLVTALESFTAFVNPECEIWGNSARFDLGILQNAYNKVKLSIPWNFRNERCLRTLVSFHPEIKNEHIFEGTAHNAIIDCYNQIVYCSAIWNKLKQK